MNINKINSSDIGCLFFAFFSRKSSYRSRLEFCAGGLQFESELWCGDSIKNNLQFEYYGCDISKVTQISKHFFIGELHKTYLPTEILNKL